MPDAKKPVTPKEFFDSVPCMHCDRLKGKVQRVFCFRRMLAEKPGRGGYSGKRPDNPFDAYCRSGTCPQGWETVRFLGVEEDYKSYLADRDSKKKKK